MSERSNRGDVERRDRVVLLVGIDLTDISEQLLAKAYDLVRSEKKDTEIHVAHVVTREPRYGRLAEGLDVGNLEERVHIESAQLELRRLCEAFIGNSGPTFVIHTPVGGVAQQLTRLADEVRADVLLVGRHDRGRRTLGRSMVARITKDAPCSVFALRERQRAPFRPSRAPHGVDAVRSNGMGRGEATALTSR